MSQSRPILILHHAGDIQQELLDFLESNGAKILELDAYQSEDEITHLITTGDQDFNALGKMFNTLEDDVKVICLGEVSDYASFVSNNGRFVLDQKWLTDPLGKIALEKFFLGKASVHLDENFPAMKQMGGFKVTNHLRLGNDMDRLSAFVHSHEGSVVNVRTFVDHAIYYLVYLKQAGIGGVPYEVDYGHTGHETIVQIHLPVKNYVAEYLLDSFGTPNGQDPLRYLLAICAQSVDYMEIQYIQTAAKLVLTGVWQNRKGSHTIRFANLMINQVYTTSQIERQIQDKIIAAKSMSMEELEKLNAKPLPGHLLEMVMPETNHNGYLKDHPDLARNLVAFVIDQWKEKYPETDISEVSENQMMDVLTEFYDGEEIAKLQDSDLQHVIERVRKNNVSKAYEQEIERVRGSLKQDDDFQKNLKDGFAENVAEKIAGGLSDEELAQLVKGQVDPPDVPVVVQGDKGEGDAAIMVRGSSAKDDLIQKITSGIEEDVGAQMIKGTPMKTSDFIMRVSQGLGEQVKGDWKFKSNLTEKVAPEKIRHQLERFANKMGQTLDKLTSSDLQLFAQTELPKVMADFVSVDESFVIPETILPELPDYKFKTQLKEEISAKMSAMFPGKTAEEAAGIITAEDQAKLLRSVVKESVQASIVQNSGMDEVQLVKSLANSLQSEETHVKEILHGSQEQMKKVESEQVIQRLFSGPDQNATGQSSDAANAILVQKIRQLEGDFNTARGQLEAAKTEIRVLKDARNKLHQIDVQAKEAVQGLVDTSNAAEVASELSVEEKLKIIDNMASGQPVDDKDAQRLKEALDREQRIIQAAKGAEADIRKAKLEIQQKEAFFAQEIEKANRALKSRDLIVQKAKDGLAMVVEKKDKEIRDLNGKISALVGQINTATQGNHAQKLKSLEQEKQSMTRLVEVYKNKLTSMAANMEKQSGSANPKKDEEVRKLTMEKQRAEVALQAAQKELGKFKNRSEMDQNEVQRLRAEKMRLEEALKSAVSTSGPVVAQSNGKIEDQAGKIRELQTELLQQSQKAGKYELNVKELEQKVAELTTLLAKGPAAQGDPAMKSKMTQLEGTVKKLSADYAAATNQLGDSKKEINKMRSENTALKNQLEKLKKDMEKAKAKPGAAGKKAA